MNKVNIEDRMALSLGPHPELAEGEDRMALSIVIVSYNTSRLLADCLNSLKAATKSLSCEVDVVDNNSQDKTCAMVRKDLPWVNLIENRKNLGYSKANNLALKKAKGKYILILNPDTIVLPNTIIKTISFLESR